MSFVNYLARGRFKLKIFNNCKAELREQLARIPQIPEDDLQQMQAIVKPKRKYS